MSAATPERVMEPGVWVTDRLVRLCGSPNVARFLAQCLYWSKTELVEKRQGWFYKSRQEWQAEVWLSRYQQERARQWLRDRKLLQERHERRQDGIRLWFRLDRLLLNTLLNNLADQSQHEKEEGITVDSPVGVDGRPLIERSDDNTTIVVNNAVYSDESKSVEECCTIVPIYAYRSPYMRENGTIVLGNIAINKSVNSDIYCNEDKAHGKLEVSGENTESATVQPNTTGDSPVSGLTCRSDNCQDNDQDDPLTAPRNTRLADYQCCHPFVYQFLKTRVFLSAPLSGRGLQQYQQEALENPERSLVQFRQRGFWHEVIQQGFACFIERWGPAIMEEYRAMGIDCPGFEVEDLVTAIQVSEIRA